MVSNRLFFSRNVPASMAAAPRRSAISPPGKPACIRMTGRASSSCWRTGGQRGPGRAGVQDPAARWRHPLAGEQRASIRDAQQRPVRLLGIHLDITQSKLAEQQLRQLSLALEQSPDGVFITDTRARIEYVNPAFLAASGYQQHEVIGRTPSPAALWPHPGCQLCRPVGCHQPRPALAWRIHQPAQGWLPLPGAGHGVAHPPGER